MRKPNKKARGGNRRLVSQSRQHFPLVFHKPNSNLPFTQETIDYKNVGLLRKYINAEGKILSRRLTALTAKQQRHIARAIKTARVTGLLPFIINQ